MVKTYLGFQEISAIFDEMDHLILSCKLSFSINPLIWLSFGSIKFEL